MVRPLLLLVALSFNASAAAPPVTAAAYRDDGQLLAVGTRGEVVFVDPSQGTVVGVSAGHTGRVTGLAFAKDGTLVAASGDPSDYGVLTTIDCADPAQPKTIAISVGPR